MAMPSLIIAAAISLLVIASPRVQPPGDSPALAELWQEPAADRDLFFGVGGAALAPDPRTPYTIVELKIRGASAGYAAHDTRGREWSVKFPPEAFTEIVASRLHWAVGYHQPPIHLMRDWRAIGADEPNPQLPARFREKRPDLGGLRSGDGWSFANNPFVGTRELNGLLVLQAIIENPDLKPSNNTVYTLKTPLEGARRWYVVRDLGYSFGHAAFNGPKGDIEAFERAPFISGVTNGRVVFHFGGLQRKLLDHIRVEDVLWICERLERLTDRQWQDAFRAGGYEPTLAQRYITRLKARVREGLALGDTARLSEK
jgi:hypothetical protein